MPHVASNSKREIGILEAPEIMRLS